MADQWTVYILQCCDKSFYTGITRDIQRRWKEHNSRRGGRYTRTRAPVKVVYQEPQPTRAAALQRESQIKTWDRKRKKALIALNPLRPRSRRRTSLLTA